MGFSVYRLISQLFNIYQALIVVWCLMSWVPVGSGGFVRSLRDAIGMLVEPYINVFRRFIPPLGGIDFSPVLAIFVLGLIEELVFRII